MTFKHQCEQSVQSVTGMLHVDVNRFLVFCFFSLLSSGHMLTKKYTTALQTESDELDCWTYSMI